MNAPTIDATPVPVVDEQSIAELEAVFAAPAPASIVDQLDAHVRIGMGEVFVFASFMSLAVGFLALIGLEVA